MADAVVEVRPPRWARVYLAVFGVVFCGAAGFGLVNAARSSPIAVVVPLVVLAVAGVVLSRGFRLSVRADGDLLVVRNNWTTRRVRRDEVEDFRIGTAAAGLPWSNAITVLLNDGSLLSLDVTMEPWPGARSRARLQGRLDALRRWRRA